MRAPTKPSLLIFLVSFLCKSLKLTTPLKAKFSMYCDIFIFIHNDISYYKLYISCWDLGRTNSPTSARREDGHGYIRIWATPPNRLVFWDGAPSPSSGIRAMPRTCPPH